MRDLYYVSIIILVILYIYPAWYICADRFFVIYLDVYASNVFASINSNNIA